ncbi:Kinetochore protein NDC80 -like protein [Echinococcus granulosus]|uniref:Kinetochore protein NDC80 n=1 Tax=Echinococcus granulosus TaxID=6210 RepID=A0A068WKX4_ECHGR|nr:Kinetochore protein NDC80 -like protein [Echinococcus granulosus]CDS19138.1 kinetochore protein ndc80 [Echinococcus granulosus]
MPRRLGVVPSDSRFSMAARRAYSSVAGQPARNSEAFPSGGSQLTRPSTAVPVRAKPKNATTTTTTCISNLVEFLSDTGYEGQVSLKALQSPSQKLVFSIFSHIMNHFAPNYFIPQDKVAFEDYFVNTLKSFGYPVALKRSTVTTPGAPHSASQILAALDWLRNELSTCVSKMDEIHFITENEAGPVGKLIFDLLLDCVAANTVEPSAEAREHFETACACSLRCRPEDVAGLEAELVEMENQPSSANLIQQERDLRCRLSATERELAEQSDHLQHLQSLLPEAEAKADAAASNAQKVRDQVGEVAAEVEKLENLVSSQRAKFGDVVTTYQRLVEHYQQRVRVKEELVQLLHERSIELGRLDKPVAPALDEYNSLAVRLTDPSLPQLKMRSYLHTFDPLKEIPVICSELADVQAKLKRSAESSAAEVARKRNELATLESSLNKKVEELDKLERDLSESTKQLEYLKRQALSKKETLNQWITETDVAIAEARQSADARQQYLKKLHTDVQQTQKDYEYYLDLNRRMSIYAETFQREVIEFMYLLKERLQGKADRRSTEEGKFEESMEELESKVSHLAIRTEDLIKEANLLAERASASLPLS